jgi:hypothetical protein
VCVWLSGLWQWAVAVGCGSGLWQWSVAVGCGSGLWQWAVVVGCGLWQWAVGCGSGLWQWAVAVFLYPNVPDSSKEEKKTKVSVPTPWRCGSVASLFLNICPRCG